MSERGIKKKRVVSAAEKKRVEARVFGLGGQRDVSEKSRNGSVGHRAHLMQIMPHSTYSSSSLRGPELEWSGISAEFNLAQLRVKEMEDVFDRGSRASYKTTTRNGSVGHGAPPVPPLAIKFSLVISTQAFPQDPYSFDHGLFVFRKLLEGVFGHVVRRGLNQNYKWVCRTPRTTDNIAIALTHISHRVPSTDQNWNRRASRANSKVSDSKEVEKISAGASGRGSKTEDSKRVRTGLLDIALGPLITPIVVQVRAGVRFPQGP
ncbi:hypothetical protein B0H16DRAFT_1775160 [Mycena metata]|uniref:Uncharacterized protein n=1 Tax=Mycena metata TaxID=1033252 RepID=A0AAD7HX66_9AGAR|nr:hypothetical protein B0H16DRAFT_1775160 [Mycena metata]